MEGYQNGKVAVITGGAGVICSVVAKELATEGIITVLVDLSMEKLKKVADQITQNGGKVDCFECDVLDENAVNKLAEAVISKYGRVDYLVNGAGGNNALAVPKIAKFDPTEFEDQRPEGFKGLYNVDMPTFEKVLLINTMGTFYPTLLLPNIWLSKNRAVLLTSLQ